MKIRFSISLILLFSLIFAQVKDETPEVSEDITLDQVLNNMKKTDESIEALVDAVKNGKPLAKAKAITALTSFQTERAYEIFVTFLGYGTLIEPNVEPGQDASWQVRANSAIGLGKLKNKKAVNELVLSIQREKNTTVKKAMIFALGEIGDDKATEIIEKEMEVTRDDAMVMECVQALGKIGSKKSFQPLLDVSTGNYLPVVKKEAIKALDKIKW